MRRALLGLFLVGLLAAQANSEAKLTCVDLQKQANRKLTDELHSTQGNHFGSLPQGELKFEDLRFQIGEGFIQLMGKAGAPQAPTRVKDIPINARFDRLHLLHTTGHGEAPQMQDGTEIGAYTLLYEGGKEERIPILYGEDLRDWWDWPDRTEIKRARVAWTGTNMPAEANGRKIRLFAVAWNNPHPELKVTTMEVSSSETNCDPMLMAVTLEQK